MKHLASTVATELVAIDRRYHADDQAEDPHAIRMARAGHPFALLYRRLRAFYDSLPFAANPGARMFSYAGEFEHAHYMAPNLMLGGAQARGPFARFASVGRHDARWLRLIELATAAGWPGESGAGIWPGSWLVRSTDASLRAALLALQDAGVSVRPLNYRGPVMILNLSATDAAAGQQARILAVLRHHHGPWLLKRHGAGTFHTATWAPARAETMAAAA